MTDQQRKFRRGQILVQIEDAEEESGALCANALGEAKRLESIAQKLRFSASLEPSSIDFTAENDVENRLTPDEVNSFPTVTSVSQLISDMKKSRQELFNFRKLRR